MSCHVSGAIVLFDVRFCLVKYLLKSICFRGLKDEEDKLGKVLTVRLQNACPVRDPFLTLPGWTACLLLVGLWLILGWT